MMTPVTMRPQRRTIATALLTPLLAVVAGCWQGSQEPAPLTVARTSPVLGDASAPVLLNDALTVYFSAALQGLSITEDSVTLLDDQGYQVPGRLETGDNWISFVPHPPLSPGLEDGSFLPGAHYRLQLAGQPRPDSIRSSDGRWLEAAVTLDVYVAERDDAPAGLPSILRPPASELPFLVRRPEVPLPIPSDDPRLVVHFTQPVLPLSARSAAFQVQVLGQSTELVPRGVEVVTTPLDALPGCSVALDLGAVPRTSEGLDRPLKSGDWISVSVRQGGGLCDYRGQLPLPGAPAIWSVVAGDTVPICVWPEDEIGYAGARALAPGFEVRGERLMPRARVEAGNGSLGVFRPLRDTTLRPGQPFDRGDGELCVSDGAVFAFSSVDVPRDVTVTVDARSGPVQLCATGGVRVVGTLALLAPCIDPPDALFSSQPAADLIEIAPVSVVAAGAVVVEGAIQREGGSGSDGAALLLAGIAGISLEGPLPPRTMLVVETRFPGAGAEIRGARGASRVYPATFTDGLAPGSSFAVAARLPWRQLPAHIDAGLLQVEHVAPGVRIDWQSTAADPISGASPDLREGRMGRWQPIRSGGVAVSGAGDFVRLRLRAELRSDAPLPEIRRLRLVQPR